jgi:AraC-like DNA-binding protein
MMIPPLDTSLLPAPGRLAAVHGFFDAAGLPITAAFDGAADASRHSLSVHRLTAAAIALEVAGTGTRLSKATGRGSEASRVYVVLQLDGGARVRHSGLEVLTTPGQLVVLDATGPVEYAWSGLARQRAIAVEYGDLGLSVEAVRAAAGRLEASPVYDLVRAHLLGSPVSSGDHVTPAVRSMLGIAFVELVRALITSAASPCARRAEHDTGAGVLRARIAYFIEQNLHDSRLTPEVVARAHSVSLRQLYNLWADVGLPVSEWIITARLERARHHLAREPYATVSQTARRCGFTNATHFARRFRQAYSMSPREWQQRHRGAGPDG